MSNEKSPKQIIVYENGKKKKTTTETVVKVKMDKQFTADEAAEFLSTVFKNKKSLKKIKIG